MGLWLLRLVLVGEPFYQTRLTKGEDVISTSTLSVRTGKMQKRSFAKGKRKRIDPIKLRDEEFEYEEKKKNMKMRRMNMRMSGRIVMKKIMKLLNLIRIRIS